MSAQVTFRYKSDNNDIALIASNDGPTNNMSSRQELFCALSPDLIPNGWGSTQDRSLIPIFTMPIPIPKPIKMTGLLSQRFTQLCKGLHPRGPVQPLERAGEGWRTHSRQQQVEKELSLEQFSTPILIQLHSKLCGCACHERGDRALLLRPGCARLSLLRRHLRAKPRLQLPSLPGP